MLGAEKRAEGEDGRAEEADLFARRGVSTSRQAAEEERAHLYATISSNA